MKLLKLPGSKEYFNWLPLKLACAVNALLILNALPVISSASNNPQNTGRPTTEQIQPCVAFTENKGQVKDQFNKQRPDVFFSGTAKGMTYHLRFDGISYQLVKARNTRNDIYRLDVNWMNINQNIKIETDKMIAGLDNFYQNNEPVVNVKTYAGVTYKNIYNNIDLHYYAKDGDLKYDYIVAPHANYKQIQLKIEGAQKITLQHNGSVFFKTSLGTVVEGAPIVYQNGKKINASWLIQDNVLSFDIPAYDPSLPLLIDPATRVWGTYYGGGPGGLAGTVGNGCTTDASGNVYLTGSTDGSNGTTIATTGAHQTTVAGFLTAFVVKFNSAGVRQWGTYYGGPGAIVANTGNVCRVDAAGNVYLAGGSSANSSISTPSCHQPVMGGVSDGYLVKFNSAGVRQWGTYFGGTALDEITSCAIDATGNIYIAGRSASPNDIATIGSHQATNGGSDDGFLAKFNSNGVQLWGTYYGDSGIDRVYGCALDAAGNVYISGETASTAGISTTGSHQGTMAGGVNDVFVAKFNSNGVRQWGTYFGGTGDESASACAVDGTGAVFVTGSTSSSSGIASLGSYQTVFGGGAKDAFIAKFNTGGVFQWGTYFGDSGTDGGNGCATDLAGNIVVTGQTASNANISTPGSHQVAYGGGTLDAFLVKFNTSGSMQWSSYYGGAGRDDGSDCAIDGSKIYMAGSTASGSGISTTGGHQANYAGPNDAFLVQFTDCTSPNAPVNTTAATNLTLCSNNSTTVSATASGPISWFGSATSTTALSTGGNYVTPSLSSGTYTYFAETTNTCSPSGRTAITVTVNPLITVNSGVICSGSSFTLVPGGVTSHTFMNGSPVVSPTVTSSYTVTGTDASGCTGAAVSTIVVNPIPVITVNSGTVCSGSSFTLQPVGASTYTFSGGTAVVSPTANSSYTITGTSVDGCASNTPAISSITVSPSPTVTASSSRSVICKGESAKLTAAGAASFTWAPNFTSTLITVSPTVTTSYTLTGKGTNGCLNKTVFTQSVNACSAISENSDDMELLIIPNPTTGNLTVRSSSEQGGILEIYSATGQLILRENLDRSGNKIDLTQNSNGIYLIRVLRDNHVVKCARIVKG